ncbi:DUF5819 family protein [Streptomyces zhaozhouensis]|nr:DUF5819 family protein [Streptomyces zhaozhouensis]
MMSSDSAAGARGEPGEERASTVTPSDDGARDDRARGGGPLAGGVDDDSLESVRLGALSLPARAVVAVAIGALAVYACWHLAMIFLFVAPSNTVREEHWGTVRAYMYPEFEQNWKLFAPNPLQRNTAVHARAEIREGAGQSPSTTEWIDLTAWEIDQIRHNPLPSHSNQNMLRRGWDFYEKSHNDDGEPVGMRGEVSASYLHRIALERLGDRLDLTTVERIQLRVVNTRVPAPNWRSEDFDTEPTAEELGWWTVTTEDLPADVRTSGDAAGRGAEAEGETEDADGGTEADGDTAADANDDTDGNEARP